MINSAIYNGQVIHKRFKPKVHHFKYKERKESNATSNGTYQTGVSRYSSQSKKD